MSDPGHTIGTVNDTKQTGFVVLEGLDGAGTTTQAAFVAEALKGRDLRVCVTAEPSEGPVGAVLRAHVRGEVTLDPHTTALAFTADRSDHLERVIRPALRDGSIVVCDRYLLSTLAYQGAEGVDRGWILDMSRGFEVPGLTVFLDLPDAVRADRMRERAAVERYEHAGLGTAIRASYLESIDLLRARGHRISVLDGTAPAAEVCRWILAELDASA